MEITREITESLDSWLTRANRQPLLMRGARQVGKTTAVRNWIKRLGLKTGEFLEINFEELPQFKGLFDQDLDVERIVRDLQFATGINLKSKNSLLFLDEIQNCPKAIMALRYFYEKLPSLPVIAAGSLVDFVLDEISFPVGRVEYLYVKPLSFFEFLSSTNRNHLREYLISTKLTEPSIEPIHQQLLGALREYFYVGGYPKAVAAYSESSSLAQVSKIHSDLLQNYLDDFPKYSNKADWDALTQVFSRIPAVVADTKVKYSALASDYRSDKVRKALHLLEQARLVHKVPVSNATKIPLISGQNPDIYKLLFIDIGLQQHALGFDWRKVPLTAELTDLHNGALAEQFVGQELISCSPDNTETKLHYWIRNQPGSQAELDYLIELAGEIVPIEVKSGVGGKLKSLGLYMKEHPHSRAIVLSQRNYFARDKVLYLPLYRAGQLQAANI